jgi:hypothetical protein
VTPGASVSRGGPTLRRDPRIDLVTAAGRVGDRNVELILPKPVLVA